VRYFCPMRIVCVYKVSIIFLTVYLTIRI
jgi:hypothetical protein